MTAPTHTVRAGDDDRQDTASLLGLALTQGYLDMTDYEQRLTDAFAAQTTGALRALTADLPVATLRRNDPRRRAARQQAARRSVGWHLAGYLSMVVVVLTVWLVVGLTAGEWYFWPVWPILGAGIGLVGHALPVRFAWASPCTSRGLRRPT
ncbi:DUF1707 domain-containing protein [Mycobacterium sp. WMMD1722]|uniref:DUF1707 domain-containing protein n=1 Tax=Mycobacterium sp. WMMD1722 TaxID=3404117 RepID=UPI003BF53596